MTTVNFHKYTKNLKGFIRFCLDNYFEDDKPTNLNEVLTDAGLGKYYVKFYGYTKKSEPIGDDETKLSDPLKSLLDYETFQQLAKLDPKHRSALQIRALLMDIELPAYDQMEKSDLIDMLIAATEHLN